LFAQASERTQLSPVARVSAPRFRRPIPIRHLSHRQPTDRRSGPMCSMFVTWPRWTTSRCSGLRPARNGSSRPPVSLRLAGYRTALPNSSSIARTGYRIYIDRFTADPKALFPSRLAKQVAGLPLACGPRRELSYSLCRKASRPGGQALASQASVRLRRDHELTTGGKFPYAEGIWLGTAQSRRRPSYTLSLDVVLIIEPLSKRRFVPSGTCAACNPHRVFYCAEDLAASRRHSISPRSCITTIV
jgi:hypothetical protein